MKNYLFFLSLVGLLGCSPYKKVTISMSQLETEKWKNKTEKDIILKLGDYKSKERTVYGYNLTYDYSTYRISNKVRVENSNPPYIFSPQISASEANKMLEVVNKRILRFFFDKEGKINSVFADGYPDSVKYVLRKGSK